MNNITELEEIQQFQMNYQEYPLISKEEVQYALKIIDRPYLFKEILIFWSNS